MPDKKIIMMLGLSPGLPQLSPKLPEISMQSEKDEEKSFLIRMLKQQDINHRELMDKLSQMNLGISRSGHAGGG